MITINLMGGTGNQLFQYALGRSLEQNDAIQFATSHFTGDPARMYMLDQLGLDDLLVVPRGDERVIHEGPMPFKPEILEVKNCVLNGYWQTEKYFLRVQDRVRREIFSAPGFFMGEKTIAVADKIKRAPNSAFLHVRRSDNLSKRALMYHGMLDGVYYRDGVAYIRERAPNAQFFVFSDDPDWCVRQDEFKGMTVVSHNPMSGTTDENGVITRKEGGREVEDLYLMSLCRHAVVANSTFSWWGAWLNPLQGSADRIVTAPKKWFLPTSNTPDPRDIFPSSWIQL